MRNAMATFRAVATGWMATIAALWASLNQIQLNLTRYIAAMFARLAGLAAIATTGATIGAAAVAGAAVTCHVALIKHNSSKEKWLAACNAINLCRRTPGCPMAQAFNNETVQNGWYNADLRTLNGCLNLFGVAPVPRIAACP